LALCVYESFFLEYLSPITKPSVLVLDSAFAIEKFVSMAPVLDGSCF